MGASHEQQHYQHQHQQQQRQRSSWQDSTDTGVPHSAYVPNRPHMPVDSQRQQHQQHSRHTGANSGSSSSRHDSSPYFSTSSAPMGGPFAYESRSHGQSQRISNAASSSASHSAAAGATVQQEAVVHTGSPSLTLGTAAPLKTRSTAGSTMSSSGGARTLRLAQFPTTGEVLVGPKMHLTLSSRQVKRQLGASLQPVELCICYSIGYRYTDIAVHVIA